MTTAQRMRRPEELATFPPEVLEQINENLTPEGTKRFMREMYEAAALAQREGDLIYVNRVLETWYRTLVFVGKPDFRERVDLARTDPGPAMDKDQLQARRAAAVAARG